VLEAPELGLAAWQIDVLYDDTNLLATGCASVPEGTCNEALAPNAVSSSGIVVDAVTGQFTAAEFTFNAIGATNGCSPLTIQVTTFVDPEDVATNPTITNGEMCILGTPEPTAAPTAAPTPAVPPCPRFTDFNPANFTNSTIIDNTLLPLVPGSEMVLEGTANGIARRVVFTITDLTKVINGVNTAVVWERDYEADQLIESKLSFFAQDDTGNVWNLGEYPEEFAAGVFTGAPNTWIAGVNLAEGGVHMAAVPPSIAEPAYLQGWAPDIGFADCARITATNESVCVPVACYNDVLVTKETSPLDSASASQNKYHAAGVGIIQITATDDPEAENLALTSNATLDAQALANARGEALALEARAYQGSPPYADTTPAEAPAGVPTPEPTPEPTLPPEPTAEPTPSTTPDGSPEPTPEPTPDSPTETPILEPTPTPVTGSTPTAAGIAPTPTGVGGISSARTPTITPSPRPRRTPVVLAEGRAPRPPLRSVRSLPNSGGEGLPGSGPIAVGWMVPMSLGLVLLGVYVYSSARRRETAEAAVRVTDPQQHPEAIAADAMFERLQTLKLEREADRELDSNRDPLLGDSKPRDE
jgi:hypothetical protein